MKRIQTGMLGAPEFEVKPQATYKPRVSPEHLGSLWRLKRTTGKPITKLVAEAIDLYLKTLSQQHKKGGDTHEIGNSEA